jgi:ABC-type Fe3+ transport system permease subunit
MIELAKKLYPIVKEQALTYATIDAYTNILIGLVFGLVTLLGGFAIFKCENEWVSRILLLFILLIPGILAGSGLVLGISNLIYINQTPDIIAIKTLWHSN